MILIKDRHGFIPSRKHNQFKSEKNTQIHNIHHQPYPPPPISKNYQFQSSNNRINTNKNINPYPNKYGNKQNQPMNTPPSMNMKQMNQPPPINMQRRPPTMNQQIPKTKAKSQNQISSNIQGNVPVSEKNNKYMNNPVNNSYIQQGNTMYNGQQQSQQPSPPQPQPQQPQQTQQPPLPMTYQSTPPPSTQYIHPQASYAQSSQAMYAQPPLQPSSVPVYAYPMPAEQPGAPSTANAAAYAGSYPAAPTAYYPSQGANAAQPIQSYSTGADYMNAYSAYYGQPAVSLPGQVATTGYPVQGVAAPVTSTLASATPTATSNVYDPNVASTISNAYSYY